MIAHAGSWTGVLALPDVPSRPSSPPLLQAFALYDELKTSGLSPDTYTFGTLFSLCAAAHQGHVALQVSSWQQDGAGGRSPAPLPGPASQTAGVAEHHCCPAGRLL